jgi:hypothetical protein
VASSVAETPLEVAVFSACEQVDVLQTRCRNLISLAETSGPKFTPQSVPESLGVRSSGPSEDPLRKSTMQQKSQIYPLARFSYLAHINTRETMMSWPSHESSRRLLLLLSRSLCLDASAARENCTIL